MMMDGVLQRKQAYRLIDELPLDRLGVVLQMLQMIIGKPCDEGHGDAPACVDVTVEEPLESDLSRFFGCLKSLPGGLALQKEARDEWD